MKAIVTAVLLAACTATPEPVPPKRACDSETCPLRVVVIADVPDEPIAASVGAGQNVVDAIESDAGEVEWIERSNANEEPSP